MPAGKTVGTETGTLGPGGFYVESRAEGQFGTRLSIIAYDSHAKVYTSYYASSAGLVGTATGTVNGSTWTWMVEDKYGGKAVKGKTKSRCYRPLSTQASRKWPTERAVTQPSSKAKPPKTGVRDAGIQSFGMKQENRVGDLRVLNGAGPL